MTSPLAGLRVIDLSTVFAGPMAAALLADQGAEVIKVESPDGDTARQIGPAKGDLSATFIAANRGKRGLALDLKAPEARDILLTLLDRADVLVQNFRPGVMDRLGLGADSLAQRCPRLVHLAITGFGADGPRAADRAYDAVIQAVAGVAASQRDATTGAPVVMASTVCDKLTALTAAQAVTAALLARTHTGRGQHVQVAMLDATLAFQWPDAMYNQIFLDDAPPPLPEFGSTQRPWRTADGHVTTMAPQQAEFRGLCTVLGRPDIMADPRFATLPARYRHGPELRAVLEPLFLQFSNAQLEAGCRAHGVPMGIVNEKPQVLTDPQVLHNQALVTLDHGDVGRVRLARSGARFDGAAQGPAGQAPHLGEHSVQILRELGLEADAVASLLSRGVVRAWGA